MSLADDRAGQLVEMVDAWQEIAKIFLHRVLVRESLAVRRGCETALFL